MMQFFTKHLKPAFAMALLALASFANAQVATNYNFSQSNGGYTPVTGPALGSLTNDDNRFVDPAAPAGSTVSTGVGLPIGFSFNYNGFTYDRFGINSNGWIGLGTTAGGVDISNTGSNYTPISSASAPTVANFRNRVAGLGFDLQGDGSANAAITYATIGSAPNRTLVVQWTNYKGYGSSQAGSLYNFQIRLNETTNVVDVMYGACTPIGTRAAQVGLGGVAPTDFNSRTGAWAASVATTINTATMSLDAATASAPTSGLTYTWTPAACQGAGILAATAVTGTTATANWSASPTALSYNLQYRVVGSATWTAFAGNPVVGTSAALSGLTALTAYEYQVQVNCAAGLTSSFSPSQIFATDCAGNSCAISFNLVDRFGDGWNGGVISVRQNGVIKGNVTLAAGSTGSQIVNVCDGAPLELVWTTLGSFAYEMGFTAVDANGNTLYTLTAPASPSTTQPLAVVGAVLYTGTAACPNCSSANTLTATALTATTATLGWTAATNATSASVEYGPTGFTPGTGTVIASATNPQIVTGLSAQTTYQFYVTVACGVLNANASAPQTFTTTCLVQPGDDPANAIPTGTLPYSSTNTLTTCYNNTAGTIRPGRDIYYQFTAPPCTDSINVSLCTATSFDSYLTIYNATTGVQVGLSSDDDCGVASITTVAVTPGVSYYAVVEGYGATTVGTFSIDITTISTAIPPVATTTSTISSCPGVADGTASVSLTAGATYLWSNGGMMASIGSLAPGTYTVTVTSACGLTATSAVTIANNPFAASLTTVTNVLCNGGNNGVADITVIGAGATPTFLWSSGDITEDLTGAVAGIYTATVTSTAGCISIITAIISEPTLLNATTTSASSTCYGSSNGSIDLTVTGGIVGYTYLWSNGAVSQDLTGLGAGLYTVTVTDSNSCFTTAEVILSEPSLLESMSSPVGIACFGGVSGTVTISPAGGTTPYAFVWNDGDVTDTRMALSPGVYTVTITDANSCSITATLDVTQPAAALALTSSNTNIFCNGSNNGTITPLATGGTAPYTFSPTPLTGLSAGTYTVTATDFNGCSATLATTITEPAAITPTITTTNVACSGGNSGSATAMPTGGTAPYTFVWSNGMMSGTIPNLPIGVYTVTISDANGCTVTNSTTITQAGTLSATVTSTNVNCFGAMNGTATANSVGGTTPYTYLWSNGGNTSTITNLMPGTYLVTVSDTNGCSLTASTVVTQPIAFSATVMPTNVACFGSTTGSAIAMPTGGTAPYTYSWSNDATITTSINPNLSAGTYFVQVSDANGCNATSSFTITEPTTGLVLTSTTTNQTTTPGNGAVALAITGGTGAYNTIWDNGATTRNLTGLSAGTYCATVTDASSCTQTLCATVSLIIETESVANFTTVKTFPNPTDGPFTLTVELGTAEDITVDIFGVTGQAIVSQTAKNATAQNFKFDLSEMPSGMYLARIKAGSETKVIKIALTK